MPHKFCNNLINENSPYLLQHAHNPVNWYPWGDEALQKAKTENKIILISIGYAACHWCHVMEKESFENEAVAQLMNQYFVNIKIDREERPDLDHIYMDAVQAITGSGGWPLNVFLTPDCKPFYGGTYFPAQKAFNRSTWTDVLNNIAQSWVEKKNEIELQAQYLLDHLKQSSHFSSSIIPENITNNFTKQNCNTIANNILKQADTVWGGFGKAPKFPQTFTIQYLLQYHYYTQDKNALNQALLSIDKMMQGGIYDHVGGGFARYSTDTQWLAPHFEKMLYDNALLIDILCDAFQITKNKKYQQAIEQTISFLQREMMHKNHGFYAAIDADSEGEEGKFYVWDKNEIDTILQTDATIFCALYDVTENGNWDKKNILRILQPIEDFATQKNINLNNLQFTLNNCLQKLFNERNKRIKPTTDDKILLGWNALAITALCKASAALQNETYKQLAIKTMSFILAKFKKANNNFEMYHTYKNATAKYPAFLDDYAYVIQSCIALQEITSDVEYLETAKKITHYVLDNFTNADTGLFFFTPKNQTDIILRKTEVYDGATPSGNSIMAQNLFYLSIIFNNALWFDIAQKNTNTLANTIIKYPTSFGVWASVILNLSFGIKEIVITGNNFDKIRNQLLHVFLPGKIVQTLGKNKTSNYPMLIGKKAGDEVAIYLCKQYSCNVPVNTVENFLAQLIN